MSEAEDVWPDDVLESIDSLNYVETIVKDRFVAREDAARLLALAALCREHLLLIGPPGTAKTRLITQFSEMIGATSFQYLLTRFTEPAEIFGPLDLKAFQTGKYHVRTTDMLPESQITFLDEVFQGSSPILNALLTILNERKFFNGSTRQVVPLLCLIGASNFIPEDPWLQAFADRFALRLAVETVDDDQIDALLTLGWELEEKAADHVLRVLKGEEPPPEEVHLKCEDLLELNRRVYEVDVSSIRSDFSQIVREIRAEGVDLSDRRSVKGLKLVAAAALKRKSRSAGVQDFWPLVYLWSRPEEAAAIRDIVGPRIAETGESPFDRSRAVADILEDLQVLQLQRPPVATDAAITAHLSALNRLRREIRRDHPRNEDAKRQVDDAIREELSRLEVTHV